VKKTVILFPLIIITFFLSTQTSHGQETDSTCNFKRPKLGLVLSGGGAKGIAHVGAIKVFEEAGLHFDYIGGTSIGSIVGSLYAIGYTPQDMAKLFSEQNWDALMTDRIPRKYISIEDRFNADRFLVSFPIRKKKVGIKSALYSGVLPELLLARLSSPTYDIFDYSELPTPFFCVGTDLQAGTAVEFNKGILHRSVRASMSIPGYFTPILIDTTLYVDGGVIDNYPAKLLHDKGCDLIVGVDVQAKMYDREELNSVISIIDQIISFNGEQAQEENHKYIDINIKPDIADFGVLDFNKYDTLLALGEQAAMKELPALKHLADSINSFGPFDTLERKPAQPLDSILITDFVFENMKEDYSNYIRNAFHFQTPQKIAYTDIDNGMMQLYGSGLFQQLYYYLIPDDDGAKLAISFQESLDASLNLGIHYDSDYKVGVLANVTLTNMAGKGSKLYADLNIGENSSFTVNYINNRSKGFSLSGKLKISDIHFNQYQKNLVTNIYNVYQNSIDVFALFRRKDQQEIRFGLNLNYGRFKSEMSDASTPYQWYFCPNLNYIVDTYDRTFFSRKGSALDFSVKYVLPLNDLSHRSDRENAIVMTLKAEKNIPVSRKITLKWGIDAGAKIGDNTLPMQYKYFVGGQSQLKYFDNFIPFTGLKFVEASGDYLLFGKFACQYKVYKKLYATLHYDMGWLNDDYEVLFHGNNFYSGAGVTFGYDSMIGPIEISIMGSNQNTKILGFLNIGYWF
jgi:Predicted esterase of the alpha-beta hydrolase superfamily